MTVEQLLRVIAIVCLLAAAVLGICHLRLDRGLRGVIEGLFPSVAAGFRIVTFEMSPRIKRLVLVAGLAFCGLMLLWMHEPLHKGKPVAYWVDAACEGYDSKPDIWEFRREVKDIGPAAVHCLAKKLRPWDGWRNAYRSLQTCLPPRLRQLLPDVLSAREVEEQRYGAAKTLALFGADARPAVGSLVRLLTQPEYPLPGLSYPVTHAAIAGLAAIGPGGKRALPVLHCLLTNQDVSLRVEIAGALWSIGCETNKVLEICTNALPSTDLWVSWYASFLLSKLQTAAAPAVPFALNLVQDRTHPAGTRATAAQVLGAARVSTPEIRAALLAGTQAGQDPDLRSNCAMALWRLDSQYAPLATRLLLEDIISLRRRFPGIKHDFTESFTEWPDIPTLKHLAESDSPEMRKEAAHVLQRIEAKTQTRAEHVNQVR
jgi:hypothetical protein